MQQTEIYKLNLMEASDPFSPQPLNENAEKTEAELGALSGRVTMLEAKYIVFGTFTGDGQRKQFIELGFTPRAILVYHVNLQMLSALALIDQPSWCSQDNVIMEIVEDGFIVYNDSTLACRMNDTKSPFNYIAFA